MYKRKTLAAVAAVLALGVAGCGGSSKKSSTSGGTSSSSSTNGGTLTIGAIQVPATWSAQDSQWANQSPYMQAVYDTLLRASATGVIQPGLATSWSWSANNTVLTLNLRSGVKFTDGTPLTAQVAAENIVRFKTGQSPNANYLSLVKTAKAVGPLKMEIVLSAPDPALLTYLTQNPGLVESAKAFGSKTVNTAPDGSGPYILDAAASVPGSSYTFTKNPNYWDPSSQHYSKLVIKYFQSTQSIIEAVQGHQVNAAATTFDGSYVNQVKSAGYSVDLYELNWEGLILFDRGGKMSKPLGNVQVRQAINYALDRPALLKAVQYGYGDATTQIFAPTSPAYDASLNNYYTYDVAKAKALMKAAGYASGFSITMPTAALFSSAMTALVGQELGAIGIHVTWQNAAVSTFIVQMLAPKWPATIMVLQQDPTPWQLANFQISQTATFNPTHYTTPTVTSLMHTMQYGSTSASNTAAKALNDYIVKQAWFAPFFRPQGIYVTDSKTNAVMQADNCVPYLWNITPKS